jgi:hypothetical protein
MAIASPVTATINKTMQARTTVGILNTVRIVGVVMFALCALILVLAGFAEWADDHTSKLAVVGIPLGIAVNAVAALVFYAVVGWFVDTLNLLTQIAKNTAINA